MSDFTYDLLTLRMNPNAGWQGWWLPSEVSLPSAEAAGALTSQQLSPWICVTQCYAPTEWAQAFRVLEIHMNGNAGISLDVTGPDTWVAGTYNGKFVGFCSADSCAAYAQGFHGTDYGDQFTVSGADTVFVFGWHGISEVLDPTPVSTPEPSTAMLWAGVVLVAILARWGQRWLT